jgi:RNase H-fold protein (predicted Holliday junction resolvase)
VKKEDDSINKFETGVAYKAPPLPLVVVMDLNRQLKIWTFEAVGVCLEVYRFDCIVVGLPVK